MTKHIRENTTFIVSYATGNREKNIRAPPNGFIVKLHFVLVSSNGRLLCCMFSFSPTDLYIITTVCYNQHPHGAVLIPFTSLMHLTVSDRTADQVLMLAPCGSRSVSLFRRVSGKLLATTGQGFIAILSSISILI